MVLSTFTEADETNYYILGTDYFNYAVGWGCEDLENNRSREYAWALTRLPQITEEVQAKVDVYIEEFLDPQFWRVTEQSDEICFSTLTAQQRELRSKLSRK